jgi:L-threonylcarbamoyladenylate synthase
MTTVMPDETGLVRATEVLAAGGIVALPTESSWGLAVDALDERALSALFMLKGRPPDQPPPVGILGEVMLGRLVAEVPAAARQLMDAWWPGPLTLVLPARAGLPQWIAPEGHVGVRESPHRVVRALLGAYGRPVTLTSANYSGDPPAMRSADLPAGIDLVLQGVAGGGAPSTIARVAADGRIDVLRRGPIVL